MKLHYELLCFCLFFCLLFYLYFTGNIPIDFQNVSLKGKEAKSSFIQAFFLLNQLFATFEKKRYESNVKNTMS